ncbi:sulfurtransferase [Pararhodospirillum oryzae]|uniref:3-mercaptopyruvate sulfurtransferase n=1 Tax=Pararhodospirillum oryzae TaxID=478448 RepID=A0A512H656_9PROT|nr:sulfurtransferase [Pararhodospirillum oryzae]GEO80927.1 sulfurtransferase [Pararhodospirillum oryzae]
MPRAAERTLVSPAWVQDHLDAPDVRILDATWVMPASGRDPRAEYEAAHIPGAVFFDIDAVARAGAPKPHTVPPPDVFASACRALGLGSHHHIVVYDRHAGAMAAARAWWLFQLFGHAEVSVLDGGWDAWVAAGGVQDATPVVPRPRAFTARLCHPWLADADQVEKALGDGRRTVIDARSAGRFNSTEPEPWDSPRGGRMPGSVNVPFGDLMTGPHGAFSAPEALRETFARAGVDLARPLIASCGTGVTACVIALGAWLAGARDIAVYDGSWFEWSRDLSRPVIG